MAPEETPSARLTAWRAAAGERLPEVIEAVFEDYRAFSAGGAPQESARDYAGHHSACRAAIAHLEALLRLARNLALCEGKAGEAGGVLAPDRRDLLREARRALGEAERPVKEETR